MTLCLFTRTKVDFPARNSREGDSENGGEGDKGPRVRHREAGKRFFPLRTTESPLYIMCQIRLVTTELSIFPRKKKSQYQIRISISEVLHHELLISSDNHSKKLFFSELIAFQKA